MDRMKRGTKGKPKEIKVPELQFLGEQDGIPERELKVKLVDFFNRDRSVEVAFLAVVDYGANLGGSIALCLQSRFCPDRGLAEKIGMIFAAMFGNHEHLDIVFLSAEQVIALEKVCRSFFRQH